MKPVRVIRSRTVVLPRQDIDTDQIIPARFLTTTERGGLGSHAFADWRYAPDGAQREDCVLNRVDLTTHRILVGGPNFGCGSSREHAAWALVDLGIAAVLSTRLADIFRANALENGLPALTIPAELHGWLCEHPGAELVIDIEAGRIDWPGGEPVAFELEPFARYRLLHGIASLDYLRRHEAQIARYEARAGRG